MVKALSSNARGVGLIPVGELGSQMPGDQKTKTEKNRSNVVTNSINTLKMAHIKNNNNNNNKL